MKHILLILTVIVLVLTMGCTRNDSPPAATGPDIFVSGYTNLTSAAYWKNGNQVILGNAFNTMGIALSANDVYVAGNIGFALPTGGGANAAVYWENGTMVRLGNDPSYANSIAVSGNDVYVCGVATVNNEYVAVYWKNGVIQTLEGAVPYSLANAITIAGTDVYIAGNAGKNGTVAVYWKNGKLVSLEAGEGNAIAIAGTDIYVAGATASGAAYWKNSIRTNLDDSSVDPVVTRTDATDIAIAGTDIHVAGYINNVYAVYWKNGKRILLNNPSTNMNVSNNKNNILVIDTTVYISFNTADYWKNGKIIHAGNGYGTGIAVKQ